MISVFEGARSNHPSLHPREKTSQQVNRLVLYSGCFKARLNPFKGFDWILNSDFLVSSNLCHSHTQVPQVDQDEASSKPKTVCTPKSNSSYRALISACCEIKRNQRTGMLQNKKNKHIACPPEMRCRALLAMSIDMQLLILE